jgi:hypothetical protein
MKSFIELHSRTLYLHFHMCSVILWFYKPKMGRFYAQEVYPNIKIIVSQLNLNLKRSEGLILESSRIRNGDIFPCYSIFHKTEGIVSCNRYFFWTSHCKWHFTNKFPTTEMNFLPNKYIELYCLLLPIPLSAYATDSETFKHGHLPEQDAR